MDFNTPLMSFLESFALETKLQKKEALQSNDEISPKKVDPFNKITIKSNNNVPTTDNSLKELEKDKLNKPMVKRKSRSSENRSFENKNIYTSTELMNSVKRQKLIMNNINIKPQGDCLPNLDESIIIEVNMSLINGNNHNTANDDKLANSTMQNVTKFETVFVQNPSQVTSLPVTRSVKSYVKPIEEQTNMKIVGQCDVCKFNNSNPSIPSNTCPLCCRIFTMQSSLMLHMCIHTGVSVKVCQTCTALFEKDNDIEMYTFFINFICLKCKKSHCRKRQHMYTPTLLPYCCDCCELRYRTFSELQKHVAQNHHVKHKCEKCEIEDILKKSIHEKQLHLSQ